MQPSATVQLKEISDETRDKCSSQRNNSKLNSTRDEAEDVSNV
jgi:hypothetical protein